MATIIDISAKITDEATPILEQLRGLKDDRQRLNQRVADSCAVLTRNHLAGLNKHDTAQRLGGTPTGYYAKKAESVEASATDEAATVSIATGDTMEAFARVDGPVTIVPRNAKYLTIPANGAAYGHRAREFGDLKFIPYATGARALVKQTISIEPGKKPGTTRKVYHNVPFYWLRPSVTLSQDRSILPSDEEFLNAAESGAIDYLEEITREAA